MRNLDHVAAFVAVIDAGGFTAAARHLEVTPQAVQKAVAQMEAELGLRLFSRTVKVGVVALTEAGAAYLEGCRRVLAAVEHVVGTLAEHRDEPGGLLRVAMPPALGRLHLLPALSGFLDRHPGIKVEALFTDRPPASPHEGVDVVFGEDTPAEPRLVVQTLAVPTIRIAASPAYLARHGTPRDLADLEDGGHECLSLVSPIAGGLFPWRFRTGSGGLEARKMRGRLAVADTDAALAAAVAGLGLAQLPDHAASQALAAGELIEVLPEHCHDGPPISISHHRDSPSLPRVRAFTDYFIDWFTSGSGGAAGAPRIRWDGRLHE